MHINYMRIFDYSFIVDLPIPARSFGLMHRILSENEILRSKINQKKGTFTKLRTIASMESIKGSNAIEGIGTTDERLRGIVLHNTEPIGHDEMEIAGYRDALEAIHERGNGLPFDDITVCGLHRMLYGHTGIDKGGRYKTADNRIIDRTPEGETTRFLPVPANETEACMDAMFQAYARALDDPEIDPLILIPCVILDFLCIHPFPDGNGRVSRLITLLLMYHNGLDIQRYESVEAAIDSTRNAYYDALKQSSVGWHTSENDYVPFITYFLNVIGMCITDLEKRRLTVSARDMNKTERIESVVLDSMIPISKAEICEILIDVSPNTVEKVLGDMVRDGKITKIGTTRSARYRRSEAVSSNPLSEPKD